MAGSQGNLAGKTALLKTEAGLLKLNQLSADGVFRESVRMK